MGYICDKIFLIGVGVLTEGGKILDGFDQLGIFLERKMYHAAVEMTGTIFPDRLSKLADRMKRQTV